MRTIYLALLLIALSSCSHKLVPDWYSSAHDHSAVAEFGNQEATVRLENLEINSEFMVFDLEIINHSDFPLHFKYEDIVSYSSLEPFQSVDELGSWKSVAYEGFQRGEALDLVAVNDLYENKLRKKKTASVLMAIAAVGLVVYDIAADANDFSSAEWTYTDARNSATRDAITASSLLALDIASSANGYSAHKVEEDLAYLPDEIFSRYVIAGGDSYRGKVYIKNKLINTHYRLAVPVEGTTYLFDFRRANARERKSIQTYY